MLYAVYGYGAAPAPVDPKGTSPKPATKRTVDRTLGSGAEVSSGVAASVEDNPVAAIAVGKVSSGGKQRGNKASHSPEAACRAGEKSKPFDEETPVGGLSPGNGNHTHST